MRLVDLTTFILLSLCLLTCTKEQVSPFPSNADVYVCGTYIPSNGGQIACYWKNGFLVDLTDGKLGAIATSIAVSGGDVYVAGYQYKQTPGITQIAKYWKNGVVTNLTDGVSDAQANSIAVVGNDVYVAGYENNQPDNGGIRIAKYWRNGVPTALGDNGIAYSIFIDGSDVYVAGENSLGAIFWKNGVAMQITDGSLAFAIAVSGSDIYVAGYQTNGNIAGTPVTIAKLWKNGVPTNLSNGTTWGDAKSIGISGSDIYVVGNEVDITYQYLSPTSPIITNTTTTTTSKYWKNGTSITLLDKVTYTAGASSVFPLGTDVFVSGNNNHGAVCWFNSKAIHLSSPGTSQGGSGIVAVKK